MDSAYFAVRPDLVLQAKEIFRIRPSALEAGEKRLLLTAQAIAGGRRADRWGHHTEAVIKKFCASTAACGQPPLPWWELLEDAHQYDGVEGVASRTGNRPLGTTNRYLVDADRLSSALISAKLSPAQLAETSAWPETFVQALLDGRWPSVSQQTARHLEDQFAESIVAPVTGKPPAADLVAVGALTESGINRPLRVFLALAVAAAVGTATWWWRETVPTSPATTPLPVELVGYWDYDEIDAQHLSHGLRVLEAPGAAFGTQWQRRLELADHGELRPRARRLWPVELHRDARRVCINYPGYPTYAAFIDAPGDDADGVYRLGPCE